MWPGVSEEMGVGERPGGLVIGRSGAERAGGGWIGGCSLFAEERDMHACMYVYLYMPRMNHFRIHRAFFFLLVF